MIRILLCDKRGNSVAGVHFEVTDADMRLTYGEFALGHLVPAFGALQRRYLWMSDYDKKMVIRQMEDGKDIKTAAADAIRTAAAQPNDNYNALRSRLISALRATGHVAEEGLEAVATVALAQTGIMTE